MNSYLSLYFFANTKEFIAKMTAIIDIIIAKLLLVIQVNSYIPRHKEIPEQI
jgi:hypothetical protein